MSLLIDFLVTKGGNLNNITRMELMQKLSRSERPVHELPKAPMYVQGIDCCDELLLITCPHIGSDPIFLKRLPGMCKSTLDGVTR